MVNRTQALVIGFFVVVVGIVVVVFTVARDVYEQALAFPSTWPAWSRPAFVVALCPFVALLAVGVLRRWRWLFWLVLVAFLFGVLRVLVAALQLTGVLPATVPAWYVALQGLIGLAQFAIGLAMLAGYRRSGVWGAF